MVIVEVTVDVILFLSKWAEDAVGTQPYIVGCCASVRPVDDNTNQQLEV